MQAYNHIHSSFGLSPNPPPLAPRPPPSPLLLPSFSHRSLLLLSSFNLTAAPLLLPLFSPASPRCSPALPGQVAHGLAAGAQPGSGSGAAVGAVEAAARTQLAHTSFELSPNPILPTPHPQGKWPMDWQPVRNLPVAAEERWEQCEGILYYEGDVRADGKIARRDVECGKWRRVPSVFEVEDKFECSCALTFDPHHADCMVPQELPKRDLERRLKMISELKLQKQQQGAEMGEWKERMGELRAFRAQHGHCHVAPRSPLGVWLQKQRMLLRRNRLSAVQREELQQLNVTINLEDARWEENFAALVDFKRDYGHLNVSHAPLAHSNTAPPPTVAAAAAASAAAAAAAAGGGDGASAGAGAGGGGGGGGAGGGAAAAAPAGISGGGVSSSGGGSSGGQQQGGGRLRRAQDLARLSQWVKAQKAMAQQPFKGKKALQRICRLLEIGFVFSEGDSSS
ncbi:unnamed protein product [Closterium sp. Yama58-4]|nr:unnamed protein product [Closterium sp. Yama58-4]